MNRKYYKLVGKRMIDSFQKNFDIPLYVYWEGDDPPPEAECIDLLNETNLTAFKERNKNKPQDDFFKAASKFAPKSYSVIHALENSQSDYTMWLDADVFVHTKIDQSFYDKVITDKMATVLGRKNRYLESGFVVYNHSHSRLQEFIDIYKACYEQDKIFDLPEWHDAFVVDWIIKKMDAPIFNLTPHGENYQHVFVDSFLGDYMDHMKGNRKKEGSSRRNDMKTRKSQSDYWKGK